MKKIISLICMFTLLVSTMSFMTISVSAAVDTSDVKLEAKFSKWEQLDLGEDGVYSALYVDVVASIPDTSEVKNTGSTLSKKYNGTLLKAIDWTLSYDPEQIVFLGELSSGPASLQLQDTGSSVKVVFGPESYTSWYYGDDPVWSLCLVALDPDYVPELEVSSNANITIADFVNASATTKYTNYNFKGYVTEASGNDYPLSIAVDDILSYNQYIASAEPEVPTAEDLGLVTDDQVAKISENVMTNNGYAINKALVFKSAIYANAAVDACGTVITCEDRQGELVIPVKDSGEVDNNVKTFYAAVTSIRDINLDKKFTAKAYADVTVGESQERVYAKDAATAVYND